MAIEYTPRVLVIDYKVPVKLDEANTATEFYDLGDADSFVDKIRTVATGRKFGHADVPVENVVLEKAELHG